MNINFSIGMVEVSGLGDAIIMLDEMCKTADVEFVATERKLGGRLVTIVVRGDLTAVKASVDKGVSMAKSLGSYKASQVIARPHAEILPYLHLDEDKVSGASEKPEIEKNSNEESKPKTTRRRTRRSAENKQ